MFKKSSIFFKNNIDLLKVIYTYDIYKYNLFEQNMFEVIVNIFLEKELFNTQIKMYSNKLLNCFVLNHNNTMVDMFPNHETTNIVLLNNSSFATYEYNTSIKKLYHENKFVLFGQNEFEPIKIKFINQNQNKCWIYINEKLLEK